MKLTRRIAARLLATLALTFVTTSTAFAGIYFESTNVTRQAGKKKGDEVFVHAWVDGDKSKVLFVDGDRGMMQEGHYLLTTDGGETLYLVNPNDENYFRWSVDGMFAGLGAIMQGLGDLFSIDFPEAHYEKLGEEPGGDVLGRSTRKVTGMTSFVMDMKMLGIKRHDRIESKQEAWITNELTDLGLGIWLRNKPPATGNEEFDALLQEGWEGMEGFPLKTLTTTTTTNKKGKTSSSVSTMDVTVLREENVASSNFVIPPHYTEIEIPLEAMAAQGAENGDGDEEGGVFKRFGFGRKKKNKD